MYIHLFVLHLHNQINKNLANMTTLKNTTGTKAVNITKDATGTFRCMYVQVYNGQEQLLASKDCSTLKVSERWAQKQLTN